MGIRGGDSPVRSTMHIHVHTHKAVHTQLRPEEPERLEDREV
jgi:hypothetical protein